MSDLQVSPEARQFVIELAKPGHPTVARIFRTAGVTRRRSKQVIAELVELAWIHRQRGVWTLMPEGRNAASWYRE